MMTKPDIWYVAFGPDKSIKSDNRAAPDNRAMSNTRTTKTFKSELDAKLFAREILAKGWTATAGTLNPHQPKRIIAASQIEDWAGARVTG
jgi:hypothetical protein